MKHAVFNRLLKIPLLPLDGLKWLISWTLRRSLFAVLRWTSRGVRLVLVLQSRVSFTSWID